MTDHARQSKNIEGNFIFCMGVYCLVCSNIFLNGKIYFVEDIRFRTPKIVVLCYNSNQILTNLALFNNNKLTTFESFHRDGTFA